MDSGRIGLGYVVVLCGRPAAGCAAFAGNHAQGAASFPRSPPAIVPCHCVPVALALAILVASMPRSLIAAYCVLGALSLLYLGLVHLPARAYGGSLRYFPKELAIALLFAAASALPAWDEAWRRAAGMPRHHPLLILCPLFAALCWLNCIAIEDWEQHRKGNRVQWLAAGDGRQLPQPLRASSTSLRAGWRLLPLSAPHFSCRFTASASQQADDVLQPISRC